MSWKGKWRIYKVIWCLWGGKDNIRYLWFIIFVINYRVRRRKDIVLKNFVN